MSTSAEIHRYCPSCGNRTELAFCPTDGVPTLERKVIQAEATVVREGDVIEGRYRITGLLGRGGFGAVYAAEHTGTQQKVALKMMLASAEAGEDEVRRFYREAQVTASLRHQNTVRVFDVGQTPAGALYIAMELLHGPTLEQVLKDKWKAGLAMSEREALLIGIPVLKSLHEAHTNKLVHRDLKPANIMLAESSDDEPTVKVLDFGIARAQDSSLTGAGTALGTPAYMSPEQCQGVELDGRSDMYSLGIILYRCVAGVPPFNDRNPLTLMFNHTQTAVPDLRQAARTSLSDGFIHIVQRSLSKRRDQRFDTARDMRVALEQLLNNGEVLSGTASRVVAAVRVDEAVDSADGDTMAAMATGDSGDRPAVVAGTTSKRTHVVRVDAATGESDATGAMESLLPSPASAATLMPPVAAPAPPNSLPGPPPAMPSSRRNLWIGMAIAAGVVAMAAVMVQSGNDAPVAANAPVQATLAPPPIAASDPSTAAGGVPVPGSGAAPTPPLGATPSGPGAAALPAGTAEAPAAAPAQAAAVAVPAQSAAAAAPAQAAGATPAAVPPTAGAPAAVPAAPAQATAKPDRVRKDPSRKVPTKAESTASDYIPD